MLSPRRLAHPPEDTSAAAGVYDDFAPDTVEGSLVVGARPRRSSARHDAPHTRIPLLMLIAVFAGVGLAYVAQTAHRTQATYIGTKLSTEQAQLRDQSQRLANELARLRSSSRIADAAGQLGMRLPAHWSYVPPTGAPLAPVPAAAQQKDGNDPLTAVLDAIAGNFGGSDVSAATP